MAPPTVILDNGAHSMKVGIASDDATPRLVPNAIVRGKADKRHYVGDQLENCTDFSSLYYRLAFEKGLLVNWGIERTIWDSLFKNVTQIEPKDSRLLITEPCFNLPAIQDNYDQIVFEEFEFGACFRTIGPELCLLNDIGGLFDENKLGSVAAVPDCALIVDSGYSFTHIVPFLKGKAIPEGVRRINVGGKLLTNQLKEVVSFRSYDMMEETYIINDVKEKCCFVSKDVYQDLDICKKPFAKNTIIQEYVLPDFINNTTGHIRTKADKPHLSDQQILAMNNERFMIPEILMHPSDIGLEQAGIPEAIAQSVHACDSAIHGLLYANIVLVGGNADIPGYLERIQQDLRQFVPIEYEIRIAKPKNPTTFAWEGGNRLISISSEKELQKTFVQRKEYLEYGSDICRRKFGSLL
ncbi:hypothetical protein INT46_005544 [Mucor plumbeus]|uniref:Actin-like protein ARP6 n=1 Tax=Mucor plumbeus TaxID=97098 RepID=A0A8H7UXM5_9FUNG|nr:hypothetical protein INT46_005544 [Mucor plumbeus]